jgi:hypothetical protein
MFWMKKARNYFKKLSIGWKIWGVFLLLSALALLIILICLIWEFIDDAIYRYWDEDIIPYLVRWLLIIAWVSYFFKKNKIVKWIFYISWILAVFLFAWLLIDDNSNFWRELDRKSSWYYEDTRSSDRVDQMKDRMRERARSNRNNDRKVKL